MPWNIHHSVASSGALSQRCSCPCRPSDALARLVSGSLLSRSAHAGMLPRSAACADSARVGHSSWCTWSGHNNHKQPWHMSRSDRLSQFPARQQGLQLPRGELAGLCKSGNVCCTLPTHRGLQQRPACPATSSERARSSSEAACSLGDGRGSPVSGSRDTSALSRRPAGLVPRVTSCRLLHQRM